MASSEREKPRGNIVNKALKFSSVPIAFTLLAQAVACGGSTVDANIPSCRDDPQPKTKEFTLFPDSDSLLVDKVSVTAIHPAGTINTKDTSFYFKHVLQYQDSHVVFKQGWHGGNPGRNYSIKAEPDTNPDNIGRDGTIVTIQADCETPAK